MSDMLSVLPQFVFVLPKLPVFGAVFSVAKIIISASQVSFALLQGYFGTLLSLITTGTLGASFWAAWPMLVQGFMNIIHCSINIGTIGLFGFFFGV